MKQMRAVRIHSFGGPGVLKIESVDVPTPVAGEILVRVTAASINPVDYKIRQGHFPKIGKGELPVTLGRDICGIVQGIDDGPEVMALLGWDQGGYAEYVTVPAALCVPKPPHLSREEAAAVPLAALTAWQGLFQYAHLKRGQRVLVHAGAGGVGHFAVQFAAACGAEVISTASTANVEFVRELGADRVIDYTQQDFADELSGVDVVYDLVGGKTQERSWKVLRKGGVLVSTLGQPDESKAAAHGVRAIGFMTEPDAGQLREIAALIEDRQVRPVLTKIFPLEEAAAAQQYVEESHPHGKVGLAIWGGPG